MARSESGPADGDFRQRRWFPDSGRNNQAHRRQARAIAFLRKDLIERGNDLVGVTLDAGHALGQEPAVDGPASH
jgi:hypothetical protein